MIKRIGRCLLAILPALVFCAIWEALAAGSQRTQFLFGSPTRVGRWLVEYWASGDALWDTLTTGSEALGGFIVGNILGTAIGLGLAYSPRVQNVAKWYVVALGAIPIFALAPMMIIWFGIGYSAKVMMAVFSTFLITTGLAYRGAQQADEELKEMLESFGASRWQVFAKVEVPTSLVWVVESFRLTVGFSLLGAFIGEFMSAERGLGYRILKAGGLYDMPGILAGVSMIVLLALVLSKVADAAGSVMLRWQRTVA